MRTLFVLALMLAASFAYGQNPPQITLSTEQVNVNGEVMYVHKVKGKETLYSLAKAYNVTIDDIVRRNDSLKGGLKEGSVIYIPSKGTAAVEKQENAVAAQVDIKKYSRKKHTVKWYEKLEDIAAKYKVTVGDIVAFNSLETTQVKKKQVLYIPNNEYLAMMAAQKEQPEVVEAAQEAAQQPEQAADAVQETVRGNDIAFILPINLRDTLGPSSNFMDFYTGALIAVEESGNADVTLIDQQIYSSMDALTSSGILEGKDAIVGPVMPADLEKVLQATCGRSLVFSPMDLSTESLAQGNPQFFQVAPPTGAQQENIARLFAKECTPEKNAVIIYEKGGVDTTFLKTTRGILDSAKVSYSTLSYGILEGREILEKMGGFMKPETANLVLVLSNSEAFVSDVVRNLNLIHTNPMEENRREITLFGLPRWRNFERIEVDYFHRMNLHLSLPYFVDYSRQNVKDFLMKYRALTNSEPTPFAFQGYDIAAYVCQMLGLGSGNQRPLQINGSYKTNGAGNGYVNCGTTDVIYNNDYTVSVIE